MFTSVRLVVHGIERFLDLMPEPLVLRAIAAPDPEASRTQPVR